MGAKVQNGMRLPQAHSLFYFGRSASRQQQEPIFRAIIPYSQPKPSSSISELPSRIPSHREKNPQAPVGFPCPLSLFLRNRAPSKLPAILTIPERDKLFTVEVINRFCPDRTQRVSLRKRAEPEHPDNLLTHDRLIWAFHCSAPDTTYSHFLF